MVGYTPRKSIASVGGKVVFVAKHDRSASDFTLTFRTSWHSAAYSRRDGQAELTWVDGYTPR